MVIYSGQRDRIQAQAVLQRPVGSSCAAAFVGFSCLIIEILSSKCLTQEVLHVLELFNLHILQSMMYTFVDGTQVHAQNAYVFCVHTEENFI